MWLVKSGIDKKEKKRLVDSGENMLLECGTSNRDYGMFHAEYMGPDEAALLPGKHLDPADTIAQNFIDAKKKSDGVVDCAAFESPSVQLDQFQF